MANLETKEFYAILSSAMNDEQIGCKGLEALLKERGINDISYKRISAYRQGEYTPPFEKAKALLEVLNLKKSDEEIVECLKANRDHVKEEVDYITDENSEIRRTIRIKLKRLLPEKSPSETEWILENRIAELYGDEKMLSAYIQGLIAKDLREFFISKEEVEDND